MKEKYIIYIGSGYVWAVNLKTGVHDWMLDEKVFPEKVEQQIQLFLKKYPKAQIIELEPNHVNIVVVILKEASTIQTISGTKKDIAHLVVNINTTGEKT